MNSEKMKGHCGKTKMDWAIKNGKTSHDFHQKASHLYNSVFVNVNVVL